MRSAYEMNSEIESRKSRTFRLAAQKKLFDAYDPRHALQEKEAWRTNGIFDDILCHHWQFYPIHKPSSQLTFKLGMTKSTETDVIYYVGDLGTAPFHRKIIDVRLLASVSTAVRGHVTLRYQCSVRTRRQNLPSSAKALASAGSTTFSECTVTQPFKKKKPPGIEYKRARDVGRPAHLELSLRSSREFWR